MPAHDVRRLKVCAGCKNLGLDLIKTNDGKHYHGQCLVKHAGLALLATLPESERNRFNVADMTATGITLDELIALRDAPSVQPAGAAVVPGSTCQACGQRLSARVRCILKLLDDPAMHSYKEIGQMVEPPASQTTVKRIAHRHGKSRPEGRPWPKVDKPRTC